MVEFQVKDEGVLGVLARIGGGLHDATPLMRAIAGIFEAETEANFAAQGRPRWLGLKPPVKSRRQGGMILQDSGQLAASVVTDYGAGHARVGSNKAYAAIHQLGGETAPHVIVPVHKKALAFGGRVVKKVNHPGSKIPARPYLPFDASGNLQPTARDAIISETQHYLRSLVSP